MNTLLISLSGAFWLSVAGAAAAGALVAWVITKLVMKAGYIREIASKESAIISRDEQIKGLKDGYDRMIEEIRRNQETAIKAARNELAATNAENLQSQNEAFKKQAEASMKTLTDPMKEKIKSLEDTLKDQKDAHIKDTASINQMVQTMSEQLNNFNVSANSLTGALRGSNTIQGHMGEQKLLTIFSQASLTEGVDYDTQVTLHDKRGNSVIDDESGKRYRPDYIFHLPDNRDIIIDAKTNINHYIKWHDAESDVEKKQAAKDNLTAIKGQINALSKQNYDGFLQNGHETQPFVIMYVSFPGALALAKEQEPHIITDAFNQSRVVIATDETILPLIYMIHAAWTRVGFISNLEAVAQQARFMCERAYDFQESHRAMGDIIAKLGEQQKKNENLLNGSKSIISAARKAEELGIRMTSRKKGGKQIQRTFLDAEALPSPDEIDEQEV